MLGRIRTSLAKTSAALGGAFADLVGRKLDDALLLEIEEGLVLADFGTDAAATITSQLRDRCRGRETGGAEWQRYLQEIIAGLLTPVVGSLAIPEAAAAKPYCILLVGVNGSGKTTSLAKLAQLYRAQGHKPLLVAGDSFRAAAVEQLEQWAQRLDCPIISGAAGADPAALAYQAWQQAASAGQDVVLIDTAGRLPNKPNLMAELQKIPRVLQKLDDSAPQQCWLVLDGTTGQNALRQVELFAQTVTITGLIVTKLDGSSKGGVLLALTQRFNLPIIALGVGEAAADLVPFDAAEFASSLLPATTP
jgi:fused signal recognition particle receptor